MLIRSVGPSFGPTYRSPVPYAGSPRELGLLPVPHWISSLLGQRRGHCVSAASNLAILLHTVTLHTHLSTTWRCLDFIDEEVVAFKVQVLPA